MKFRSETFGFTVKSVKGGRYVYFWHREASGQKIEKCLGPADKPETQRRKLQTELTYLKSLERELGERIQEAKQELDILGLPVDEEKSVHGRGTGRGTTAKGPVEGSVDGSREKRDEGQRKKI